MTELRCLKPDGGCTKRTILPVCFRCARDCGFPTNWRRRVLGTLPYDQYRTETLTNARKTRPRRSSLLVRDIIELVSVQTRIRVDAITARPKNKQRVSQARQLSMALAVELSGRSTPHIGRVYSNRDHGTVLNAMLAVNYRRKVVPHIDQTYELIKLVILTHEAQSVARLTLWPEGNWW